jgi:hypothetical protein
MLLISNSMTGSGTIHVQNLWQWIRKANNRFLSVISSFWGDRGKLDGNRRLQDFAKKLEEATVGTVEGAKMTKDLAILLHGSKYV